MNKKSDDWMDLYRKEPEPEEEFLIPEGPILFYNELVQEQFDQPPEYRRDSGSRWGGPHWRSRVRGPDGTLD